VAYHAQPENDKLILTEGKAKNETDPSPPSIITVLPVLRQPYSDKSC